MDMFGRIKVETCVENTEFYCFYSVKYDKITRDTMTYLL